MAKSDVLVRMKADTTGYDANIAKARRQLDQFKKDNLSMGGVMKQLSGSLVMTAAKFASVTAAAGALSAAFKDVATESIQLAKDGEGIRLAFDRLNDPNLLNNLREATHNTVTDIELMKAAVKFNDFKLPLEELGTMLAFAQQKAKDTGQSVDYMVDSIVTGLGRKSKLILDNLGLSAAEIDEKMKQTGDMTKAVGEIIREQMAQAGDYVETAAERATQAEVQLKNAMEELGRTLMPLEEQGVNLFTNIKLRTIEWLNDGLKPAVPALIELKTSIGDIYDTLSNNTVLDGFTDWLSTGLDICTRFVPYLREVRRLLDFNGSGDMGASVGGGIGKALINYGTVTPGENGQLNEVVVTGNKPKNKKTPSTKTPKTEEQLNNEQINKLTQEYIKASEQRQETIRAEIKVLQDRNEVIRQMKDEALGKAKVGGIQAVDVSGLGISSFENPFEKYKDAAIQLKTPLQALEEELKNIRALQEAAWSPEVFAAYEQRAQEVQGKIDAFKGIKKDADASAKSFQAAAGAISTVGSALSSIEDPSAKIFGIVAQAIATIANAFASALGSDTTTKGNIWAFIGASAASMTAMAAAIAQIHSATGYASGGVIKGNSYSGDNIGGLVDGSQFVGLNAGEVVLNASQQNMLANNLQGNGGDGGYRPSHISGEQIWIAMNRYTKRTGRGELVTWK